MRNISLLLLLLAVFACSKEESSTSEVLFYDKWEGEMFLFEKETGADPIKEENQDKITESVSITRGNNGGEIYNATAENQSSKGISPIGTEWAIGEMDNIIDLKFQSFRATVGSPKSVVGKKLVLHIIEEDVYLSIEFTKWGESRDGGFSYKRSTKN